MNNIKIKEIINQLKKRQLLKQVTDEQKLISIIKEKKSFYCGFDPTANSLHFGHFLLLNLLFELKNLGCQPIVVLGTTTAKIGDPSFRITKRIPLSNDEISKNKNNIKKQILTFIKGLSSIEKIKNNNFIEKKNCEIIFLENGEWLDKISILEFLTQVGDLFTVNKILQRQSLKDALKRDALFYSDFSYILLQAYDFYHLYKEYDCRLQIGGSDQFPNLVFGTDLIKKKIHKNDICAVTTNLLTNSKGKKISKSLDFNILFHQKDTLNWSQKLSHHLKKIKNKNGVHFLLIKESFLDIFPFFLSLDDQTIMNWNVTFNFQKYCYTPLIKKNWNQWTLQKRVLWFVNKIYFFLLKEHNSSKLTSFDWFTFFWNHRHDNNNKIFNQFIKIFYCNDQIEQKKMIDQLYQNEKFHDHPKMIIDDYFNLIPSLWISNNQKWSLLQILTKLMSFNKAKKLLQNNNIVIDDYKISQEIDDVFAFINHHQNENKKIDQFILYCGKNKMYFVKFII